MDSNNNEVSRTGAGLDLREQLAELAHSQWSGWMQYLFGKCVQLDNGNLVIPVGQVERWTRQMNTPYADLSEPEKDSDRTEADKFLAVMEEEVRRLRASIEYFIQAKSEVIDQLGEAENEIQRLRAENEEWERTDRYLSEVVRCAIAVDNERWYPIAPTAQINVGKLGALHDALVKLGTRPQAAIEAAQQGREGE